MRINNKILLFALISVLLAAVVAAELPIGVQKVIEHERKIALSVTFFIAFIAGVLTFTSPCGFVVLPMFFSYLFKERKRAVWMTTAFIIGMVIAFATFGIIAGFVGDFFNSYKRQFAFLSGFVLLFFGALLFLNKGFSFFNFKVNHIQKKSFFSILALGFFFAVGWTPCVGPILGGILFLAANVGTVLSAAFLLIFYSLGVGFPLVIVAYFSDKFDWANARWLTGKTLELSLFGKRIITHTYNIIGGVLLIIIGIIMIAYKGTTFFTETIPNYLPWTMNWFVDANYALLNSKLVTSDLSNLIGLLLIAAFIFIVIKYLVKAHS